MILTTLRPPTSFHSTWMIPLLVLPTTYHTQLILPSQVRQMTSPPVPHTRGSTFLYSTPLSIAFSYSPIPNWPWPDQRGAPPFPSLDTLKSLVSTFQTHITFAQPSSTEADKASRRLNILCVLAGSRWSQDKKISPHLQIPSQFDYSICRFNLASPLLCLLNHYVSKCSKLCNQNNYWHPQDDFHWPPPPRSTALPCWWLNLSVLQITSFAGKTLSQAA